jgi:hypothetical protein
MFGDVGVRHQLAIARHHVSAGNRIGQAIDQLERQLGVLHRA